MSRSFSVASKRQPVACLFDLRYSQGAVSVMRLVNKKTLVLEWFTDGEVPPYVILSHRWVGRETSLQEYSLQSQRNEHSWSDGVQKVVRFCYEIAQRPENYVWIDTCCIDKTSSAELQEAINSMYKWYQQAEICVALLDDVDEGSESSIDWMESKWWTRGWTLQELLAPHTLLFVDKHWRSIGFKSDLKFLIADLTGIPEHCLQYPEQIHARSVAERLSWMSDRQTTRAEDLAYCMLGVMNVNLTMLYGEGQRAFFRLQKEILDSVDDESIFLWSLNSSNTLLSSSMLAPSPNCFEMCRRYKIKRNIFFNRSPLRFSAKGLELEVYGGQGFGSASAMKVPLNCTMDDNRAYITIANMSNSTRWYWERISYLPPGMLEEGTYGTPPVSAIGPDSNAPKSRLTRRTIDVLRGVPQPLGPVTEETYLFKLFVK